MSLHPRLEADTLAICETTNAFVRLMNDCRWPWIILVPKNSTVEELHDFTETERNLFLTDVNAISKKLQQITNCQSINVAMLGNVVTQLHCHIVARNQGDPNWPKPIWGFESAKPYIHEDLQAKEISETIRSLFL